MAAYFECTPLSGRRFKFKLRTAGHDIVLSSKGYATEAACLAGIESAREHARQPLNFLRKRSRDQSSYFVLVAANQQALASSVRYASVAAMEAGLAFVSAHAPAAVVGAPLAAGLWSVAMAMVRPSSAANALLVAELN